MSLEPPKEMLEFAARTVDYVKRALGLELAFDSDTLPLLDHYLRTVPGDQPAMVELVVLTAGAYFGEVVRRRLGGRWDLATEDVLGWRMVLPTGINFSPSGFVAAAIVQGELDDLDTALDAPPRTKPHLERALERMGEVTVDDFYSLCGRLDTLEHVHEVLVAVAAHLMGGARADDTGEDDGGELASLTAEKPDAEGDEVEPTTPPSSPDEGERLN